MKYPKCLAIVNHSVINLSMYMMIFKYILWTNDK